MKEQRYLVEVRGERGSWVASVYRRVRDGNGRDALASVGPSLRAPTRLALCSRLIRRLT